jgi:hypothetical protein
MTRALILLDQIIRLSKEVKKQLEYNETTYAKRLLSSILRLQTQEFPFLERESGSRKLYDECVSIYEETKTALETLEQGNTAKAKEVLDRIIALENIERVHVTEKEGLDQDTLVSIDTTIRDLCNDLSRLSFVKKTHFSCSSNPDDEQHVSTRDSWGMSAKGYVVLDFDWQSKNAHAIVWFNDALKKIPNLRITTPAQQGIDITYHGWPDLVKGAPRIVYQQDKKTTKEETLRFWLLFKRVVSKF